MLGAEQALDQPKASLRWAYRLLGEFRYPARMRARAVLAWLPRDLRPRAVWDAGCGAGELAFALARRYPEAQVVASDLNARWVHRGNRLAAWAGQRNLVFRQEDLRAAAHPRAFDLVVCCDVLEHVDDDRAAARHLAESLRARGVLLVHVPARGPFQSPSFGFRRWKRPARSVVPEPGQAHVREGYTPAELVSLLTAYGLVVERWRWTFGVLAMYAYTLHELLEQRRLAYCAAALPFLMAVGVVDEWLPHGEGAGVLLRARAA